MSNRSWRNQYDEDTLRRVDERDYASGGADAALMSDEDYARVLRNRSLWQDADAAGRAALHDDTERIRSAYGYSGGAAGDEYLPTGESYGKAPDYVSRYQEQIDALSREILDRAPFSWDYAADPAWQSYKKEYARKGQRAAQDALGRYAAMTGGTPSTAAVTAASQAGDYYAAQLSDKLPELYQLAYAMYQDEGDALRRQLSMLTGLEDADYDRYLDALGQYNKDRSFDYTRSRDARSDARYADETDYERAQDAASRELALAKLAAQYGDDSGLRALGVTPAEDAAASSASSSASSSAVGRGLAPGDPQDRTTLYEQMRALGCAGEGDAYEWLTRSGYGPTQAGKLAAYFAQWLAETEEAERAAAAQLARREQTAALRSVGAIPDAFASTPMQHIRDPLGLGR